MHFPLHSARPAGPSGSGANGVLLLLADAAEQRHWMLDRLLTRAGQVKDAFLIANLTDTPLPDLSALCKREKVRVVVLMGERVGKAMLGIAPSDYHRWLARLIPGSPLSAFEWMVPCLAPTQLLASAPVAAPDDLNDDMLNEADALRHPPRYTIYCMRILQRAVAAAKGDVPADPQAQQRYSRDPDPFAFRQWGQAALASGAAVAFDIETNYHDRKKKMSEGADLGIDANERITRISFAYGPGVAVSVPYEGQYVGIANQILASPVDKISWNGWQFDAPMLARIGGATLGGVHYDAQDGWHLFQSDLPKGLEHVSAEYEPRQLPWKHLSGDPDQMTVYSCIDADMTWRLWQGIRKDLERAGQWAFFERQARLMPILDAAGRRGTLIDTGVQEELRAEFATALAQELVALQAHVPKVLATPASDKLRMRVTPREGWQWVEVASAQEVQACADCGKTKVNRKHACKSAPGAWRMEKVLLPVTKYAARLLPEADTAAIREWVTDWGFNPASTDQMRAYAQLRGHELGYNPKTKKESLDTKQIERLFRQHKDPLYGHTITTRKIGKALSTYVEAIKPRPDGRVGTVYVNAPSTWRLASRYPNLQNQPKRGGNKWAKRARAMFIPSPGHVFVQADYSAIEAVLVGWFMGDADYIVLAKKSIHAYVCAVELGWVSKPEDFTLEMAARVKDDPQHTDLYNRIKTVVHGSNYGMSPYLMWKSMETMFPTLGIAQAAQKTLFRALPGLQAWQFATQARAQKECYLENPWKVRHYFFDVFTWQYDPVTHELLETKDGAPKVKHGKDSKRATAFLPQSSAGCVMRDTLLLVADSWLGEYMPAHVSVHDSICVDVPEAMAAAAAEELVRIMTRPIPELNGLQIGVEVEQGHNWLHMEKVGTFPMLHGGNGLVPTDELVLG